MGTKARKPILVFFMIMCAINLSACGVWASGYSAGSAAAFECDQDGYTNGYSGGVRV